MNVPWYAMTGEDRAEAKALDEQERQSRQQRFEQQEWTHVRALEHCVHLYSKRVGSRLRFAFRGGSKLFHTWHGGHDVAGRRLAWCLALGNLRELPPRMRATLPRDATWLVLRRGELEEVVFLPTANSLKFAIERLREREKQ